MRSKACSSHFTPHSSFLSSGPRHGHLLPWAGGHVARGGTSMKELRCGDVMPGCDYVAKAETEDELMQQAAVHAREVHGLEEVTPEVAKMVKGVIRTTG